VVRFLARGKRFFLYQDYGCTNPGRLVGQATKFYTVALAIFSIIILGPPPLMWNDAAGNLLHVTPLLPGSWMWLLDFWKICGFLTRAPRTALRPKPVSYVMDTGALATETKRLERGDLSPPSIPEFWNTWSYISTDLYVFRIWCN
jgi:hypothetical protein